MDKEKQDMNELKEISQLDLPNDVLYTEDHAWVKLDNGKVRVGISDYAQNRFGKVVYVELPTVGEVFKKGDVFGIWESEKTIAELIMPIGGEIFAVNSILEESPSLLNKSPYIQGWIIDVKTSDPSEVEGLMTKDAYVKMLLSS